MGAVAFCAQRPRIAAPDCPYAWVNMPVLNDESVFEVWTCAQPVVREDTGELSSARNEAMLFGCLQLRLDRALDAASYLAYSRIFDFIDSLGYGHLLRVWNYFPQINADADGTERYVRFNAGRHEAFAANGRVIATDTPAACALGSRGHQSGHLFSGRETGRATGGESPPNQRLSVSRAVRAAQPNFCARDVDANCRRVAAVRFRDRQYCRA